MVRLGTWLPFEPTAQMATQQAGAAYVRVQTAQRQALARAVPTEDHADDLPL